MIVTEETRKARRKGKNATNEFFTPSDLVKHMCDKVSESDWADTTKTFLEPSFGNGNFIVEIVERRLSYGIDWQTVLETLYGVELMEDNVVECKERVINLLNSLGVAFNEDTAMDIMDNNLVCSDFFKWDFENWKPL